jgi:hypothetical protein
LAARMTVFLSTMTASSLRDSGLVLLPRPVQA